MRVRLIRPWSFWSVGQLFEDMPGGQARTLIERNVAVEDKSEPEKRSVMLAPVDRMISAAQEIVKRGRGRPKKAGISAGDLKSLQVAGLVRLTDQ